MAWEGDSLDAYRPQLWPSIFNHVEMEDAVLPTSYIKDCKKPAGGNRNVEDVSTKASGPGVYSRLAIASRLSGKGISATSSSQVPLKIRSGVGHGYINAQTVGRRPKRVAFCTD